MVNCTNDEGGKYFLSVSHVLTLKSMWHTKSPVHAVTE